MCTVVEYLSQWPGVTIDMIVALCYLWRSCPECLCRWVSEGNSDVARTLHMTLTVQAPMYHTHVYKNSTPTSKCNPTSIHSLPETAPEREQDEILLNDKLVLQDMLPLETISVKRNSLFIALSSGSKIRLLLIELEHAWNSQWRCHVFTYPNNSLYSVSWKRVGIKILTILSIAGLLNAKKGAL